MNFIGLVVTVFRQEGQEIDVTLMHPEEAHHQIADLEDMKVHTNEGASIPISEVAECIEAQGPVTLVRQNQHAQMSATTDVSDRDINSVISDIEKQLETLNLTE